MDNIKCAAWSICRGATDSVRGAHVVFRVDGEVNRKPASRDGERTRAATTVSGGDKSRVLLRVAQCCALNGGVFLASTLAFYWAVLPALGALLRAAGADAAWRYTRTLLSLVFEAVWVLPLFALSRVVNSLWFQDVADWSYRYSTCGRPRRPAIAPSRLVADSLASALVQLLFLAQAQLVAWLPLPLIADALAVLHFALLYALYAFEYRWYNVGWELHKRLAYVELHWPYFLGFGLPLALLTHVATASSWVVSGCVFSVLFPLFIVSGNEATPIESRAGAPPLRLFSPVVALSNALFTHTVTGASTQTASR